MAHDNHDHSGRLTLGLVTKPSATAVDPVCGMTVDPAGAAGSVVHAGTTYHFCSRHCVEKFQADPQRYLAKSAPEPSQSGAKYTCPMHPEVVQDSPGTCPKCGMALEPMLPVANAGPDPELVEMQRRLWLGGSLALPVFLIAMAAILPSSALRMWLHEHMRLLNWLQLVLATPVVLWCGKPFFERAWVSVIHRSPNMFTLIAMGVGAAYG